MKAGLQYVDCSMFNNYATEMIFVHVDLLAVNGPNLYDEVKAHAYKAKLLFSGEGAPVGQFRAEGTRVCTRIYFDARDNWTSCIRIEVKAFVRSPPARDRPPEEELVYKWVVRLNFACDHSTEPEVHVYPKAFLGKKEDDYLEKAYIDYCVNVKDQDIEHDRKKTWNMLHSLTDPQYANKIGSMKFSVLQPSHTNVLCIDQEFDRKEN